MLLLKKTAIITGCNRGIGKATLETFAENGADIFACVRKESAEFTDLITKLAVKTGVSITPVYFDLAESEQIKVGIKTIISSKKQIDILVNNAGVASFGPIEKINNETWHQVMATNLDGVFYLTQAVTPILKQTKGTIVNIASISGLRASTLRVAYGTSKAAVMQLTKQQAVELGEYGIRVNAVAPGPVRTKLAMAVHTQEIIDTYHDHIPLNRYATEREIGEVIYFLCSDKASYVTGQIVAVDGGFEASGVGLPALRR
jgi:NAD(P)-dependent dehydrogenase (short-subunit alcohol dehydrogenase family)